MRDYNPKKPKEYHMERTLYLRVLYTVRDYPRMVERVNDILYGGSSSDGMPRSNAVSNPTEAKALAIADTQNVLHQIDDALKQVPTEYRQHIFNNVVYGIAYPLDYADRSTWSRWRVKFLYGVAENLKLI